MVLAILVSSALASGCAGVGVGWRPTLQASRVSEYRCRANQDSTLVAENLLRRQEDRAVLHISELGTQGSYTGLPSTRPFLAGGKTWLCDRAIGQPDNLVD